MACKVLIVRSVSFQHLDWVLSEVKSLWPDSTLTLLTHAHGRQAALQTRGIDDVLIYGDSGDFSFWRIKKAVAGHGRYDQLIVPFSNCSGAGFGNVVAMAFRIQAGRRWLLPLKGKPLPLRWRWWLRTPAVFVTKTLSLMLTILAAPLLLAYLLVRIVLDRLGRSGAA